MDETNNTVAAAQERAAEQPADDAQGAGAAQEEEFSALELARSLMEGEDARETVEEQEDAGDDGQGLTGSPGGDLRQGGDRRQDTQEDRQEAGDKFSRRIASALKNQERTLLAELGGGTLTKAEMKEIIRAHQACKMHEEDPDISPKAERKIIEAREATFTQEQAKSEQGAQVEQLSAQLRELVSDGWTREELTALCADEAVRADIEDGKTLQQAARAYERRAREAAAKQENTKRAVRPARSTAAGDSPQPDLIRSIPDDKYDAFMAELRRRAMRGEKVRI